MPYKGPRRWQKPLGWSLKLKPLSHDDESWTNLWDVFGKFWRKGIGVIVWNYDRIYIIYCIVYLILHIYLLIYLYRSLPATKTFLGSAFLPISMFSVSGSGAFR